MHKNEKLMTSLVRGEIFMIAQDLVTGKDHLTQVTTSPHLVLLRFAMFCDSLPELTSRYCKKVISINHGQFVRLSTPLESVDRDTAQQRRILYPTRLSVSSAIRTIRQIVPLMAVALSLQSEPDTPRNCCRYNSIVRFRAGHVPANDDQDIASCSYYYIIITAGTV